jgi:hypothetical protein
LLCACRMPDKARRRMQRARQLRSAHPLSLKALPAKADGGGHSAVTLASGRLRLDGAVWPSAWADEEVMAYSYQVGIQRQRHTRGPT